MNGSRALLLALLAVAGSAAANHDESIGARFVQPGGVDAGNCLDDHAPCVSIQYALAQAEPGNTVKVGAGIFDLSGVDPETFLHGPVHATGGYGDADHYYESRPLAVQSIVVGVDARYRNALAVRGFHWAESADAARRGVFTFAGGAALQQTQAVAAECVQGMAGQFPCRNLDFQSQISLAQFSSRPVSAANVWGFVDRNDNREYAVVGLRNGTAIVEVTDPVNPREVITIPGNSSPWREVKVYQVFDAGAQRWRAYAYVTTEAANSGLQTIDLSGLPQTASLASTSNDTGRQHTLYVSNIDYATNAALPGMTPVLYVAGSDRNGGSWRAYSLANPTSPRFIGEAPPMLYMHDSTSLILTGARAAQCAPGHDPCEVLVDFNVEAVELWDVTSKSQPFLLGTATNPNNRYIHSGWPSADQRYVFFHDELEEIQFGLQTRIYALDVADVRAPRVVTSYTGPTSTTDHNGYTVGDRYYVSHYRRGVVVFDAANPERLVEVAHFDNYLAPSTNSAGTDGTWGVYPFLRSGNLLVSDIENGLFVLRDQTRNLDAGSGRLGFTQLSLPAAEGFSPINVRVQRSLGRAGDVSVQYATAAGSATEGADYTAATGTLSWSSGDLADKVIAIAIAEDSSLETAETLTVTLSNLTGGATLDGSSTLTVTINDNDSTAPIAGGGGSGGGGGGGSSDVVLLVLLAGVLLARRAARLRRPTSR
ncbi:MAG TPA: choice-of-anchor B family protein [Gammaproteobacteria bacterium]|nr:choice-of-anchor B family protein [Gammaproteobacteria bacterium]